MIPVDFIAFRGDVNYRGAEFRSLRAGDGTYFCFHMGHEVLLAKRTGYGAEHGIVGPVAHIPADFVSTWFRFEDGAAMPPGWENAQTEIQKREQIILPKKNSFPPARDTKRV